MNPYAIGIDLGKTVFHLVGLNQIGEIVVGKSSRVRSFLLHFERPGRSDWDGKPVQVLTSSARPCASRGMRRD